MNGDVELNSTMDCFTYHILVTQLHIYIFLIHKSCQRNLPARLSQSHRCEHLNEPYPEDMANTNLPLASLLFLHTDLLLQDLWFSVLTVFSKTFEAKIHHLETRLRRKPKDNLEALEYFVRCEVHLSDVNTLVGSIKRNAEDVKTTKEVKCNIIFLLCFRKEKEKSSVSSLAAPVIFKGKEKNRN